MRRHSTPPLRKLSLFLLILGWVMAASPGDSPGQIDWNNTTGSPDPWYDVSTNWLGGLRPGSSDLARFQSADTYEVWWDSNTPVIAPDVGFLEVSNGDVTFLNTDGLLQHTLVINGAGGSSGLSDLSITGPSTRLTLRGVHLHSLGGAQITDGATVILDGTHSAGARLTVDASGLFQINGNLDAISGGVLNSDTAMIGIDPGMTGVVNITDGAEWNNTGGISIGRNGGTGTLNITNGGIVNSVFGNLGGPGGGSNAALVTGAGSQWNLSSGLTVWGSSSGTSELLISDGGLVSSWGISIGELHGTHSSQVTVTGAGSQMNSTAGNVLMIGNLAEGTLNIESSGVVNVAGSAYVGRFNPGNVNVTGVGSEWNINGTLHAAQYDDAVIHVTDGGVVNVETTRIGSQSSSANGSVTIQGAGSVWNSGNDLIVGEMGTGSLTVVAGGQFNAQTVGIVGSDLGSDGAIVVNGSGSQFNNIDNLIVGSFGSGALTVENMGVVNSQSSAIVGDDAGSSGTVTVTHSGSRWDVADFLTVGQAGSGGLEISNGGVVSNSTGIVGQSSTGNGSVTVHGLGSGWNNSFNLSVGDFGVGSLRIEDGGTVLGVGGWIGNNTPSEGTIVVSGDDSLLALSENLRIGRLGTGRMEIQDGGSVTNSYSYVGMEAGSIGDAVVEGTGSDWTSSLLYVGYQGSGALTIDAGGTVSSITGSIGSWAGSTGTVHVSGTGSTWANSVNLLVASGGTGTLHISDNGLVTVGSTTSIGENGMVHLSGGRFEFGQLSVAELTRIQGTSGSLAGTVAHTGFTDVQSLGVLRIPSIDASDVDFINSGTLYGNANLGIALHNTATGTVQTAAGERMRFSGPGNSNQGEIASYGGQFIFAEGLTNTHEINNYGGQLIVGQTLVNEATGFVGGRGQFIANGGWINDGVLAFSSGNADIQGDVLVQGSGQVITSGNATTTFFDDVIHNGSEIRTAVGSHTVFFGEMTGAGSFTGTGTVFFEGDLRPGNSPDVLRFEGDVVLGATAQTHIELGGEDWGLFDHLDIEGDVELNGELLVALYDGFGLRFNQSFQIIDVNGVRTGTFNSLGEGDLIGNFDGIDLFITYQGGDGNDVVLLTAVPEPSWIAILTCGLLGLSLRRRRMERSIVSG